MPSQSILRPPTPSTLPPHHPHYTQVFSQSPRSPATQCLPCPLLSRPGSVREVPPNVPLSILPPNWPGPPPPNPTPPHCGSARVRKPRPPTGSEENGPASLTILDPPPRPALLGEVARPGSRPAAALCARTRRSASFQSELRVPLRVQSSLLHECPHHWELLPHPQANRVTRPRKSISPAQQWNGGCKAGEPYCSQQVRG